MHLVVISYYASRDIDNLQKIIAQILFSSSGSNIEVCIVANVDPSVEALDDAHTRISVTTSRTIQTLSMSREFSTDRILPKIHIHTKENIGMNIGAWDYAWRIHPDFETYLFIQDEVIIMQENWYSVFLYKASSFVNTNTPFLIGETWNNQWHKDWDFLRRSRENYDVDVGDAIVPRIDYFLYNFKRWGINALDHGGHLRSLVWFMDRNTLNQIEGFPIGSNYHECVASEISVSLKIRSMGGVTVQLCDPPFSFIWHPEW